METDHTIHSTKKSELQIEVREPDPDTICGIGSFQPRWLQGWATARSYLLLYSILGTLSGTYYTYRIGVMTTLEKRFAFNSKVSGLIMMVDEVTPIFLGVPVGHWAARTHRPRMISLGMLMVTLCCFMSSLPYFIYGPETQLSVSRGPKNETGLEVCDPSLRGQECEVDGRPPTVPAVLLFILAGLFKGFGNIAYHAIGIAYMDDITKKKNSPLYLATTCSLRMFGPILGYLMSSAFLKYYENPFDNPRYDTEDPRWIGGWWMGFLLQGFLILIFSALIALFPRRLPGQKPNAEDKDGQVLDFSIAGLLASLKRLATNPICVLIILRTVLAIGNIGHYMMLPKYMEHQFRLSASDASLYSGPPALAALMSSMMVGGYLMWRFRPSARVLTFCIFVLEVIAAIGPLLLIIPQCDTIHMAHYGVNDNGFILETECNRNCNCSKSAFTPVCGSDGRTVYFSPCHAGCTQADNQTLSSCSCLWDTEGLQVDSVTEGLCAAEACWSQALVYIISLPALQFITSLLGVAYTMILFRSVHPSDKSIAVGFLETFLCLFGFLPFLTVFSALVDSACLVWEESCGDKGNCWFYDVPRFNYLMHGTSAAASALSALTVLAIFFLSSRIGDLYGDDSTSQCSKTDVTEKTSIPPLKGHCLLK